MNKTKIEWCDYTWNPITGCKRGCSYCYGKKIRQRFTPDIPWDELIRFNERLSRPLEIKKPSRIFVNSMSDIEYWSNKDMDNVFKVIRQCPQHTFIFLTKNGDIYSKYYFPENCWLGVTSVDGHYKFRVQRGRLMFLSIEPLLKEPQGLWLNSLISWIIIGGLTPKPVHKKEWITNILKEADRLSIPVFIKSNAHYPETREELPNPLNQCKEKFELVKLYKQAFDIPWYHPIKKIKAGIKAVKADEQFRKRYPLEVRQKDIPGG